MPKVGLEALSSLQKMGSGESWRKFTGLERQGETEMQKVRRWSCHISFSTSPTCSTNTALAMDVDKMLRITFPMQEVVSTAGGRHYETIAEYIQTLSELDNGVNRSLGAYTPDEWK